MSKSVFTKQAGLRGLRVKVRVPTSLWEEVKHCAAVVGCPIEDWTYAICRDYAQRKFSVPDNALHEIGTREKSVTVWVQTPMEFNLECQNLRKALRAGVEYVKPKLPPAFRSVCGEYEISGQGVCVTIKKRGEG